MIPGSVVGLAIVLMTGTVTESVSAYAPRVGRETTVTGNWSASAEATTTRLSVAARENVSTLMFASVSQAFLVSNALMMAGCVMASPRMAMVFAVIGVLAMTMVLKTGYVLVILVGRDHPARTVPSSPAMAYCLMPPWSAEETEYVQRKIPVSVITPTPESGVRR